MDESEALRPEEFLHPPEPVKLEPRSRLRWWVVAIMVVPSLAAAGFLGFLFTDVSADRDDTKASLAAVRVELDLAEERETARNAEIAELRTRLDASETHAAELRDRIDGLAADLVESDGELAASGDTVDDALAALSAMEKRLVDSQADLVAARESLGEAELVRAGVVDFFVTFVGSATGIVGSGQICIAEEMLQDVGMVRLLELTAATGAAESASDPDAVTFALEVSRAAEACGHPLDTLPGDPALGTYGDDPFLDSLYDQCTEGSARACDALYFEAPVNSEYELFGATCGGRFEVELVPFVCEGSI